MADDPKTWTVVQKIVESLQVITVAGGYHTDAGLHVTDEPAQVSQDAPMAVGVAFIGKEPPTGQGVQRTHRLANFAIVAKVSTSLETAQITLHQLVDDIETAMEGQQKRYPSGIQFPQYVKTEVIPPVEGAGWVGARVFVQSHVPNSR